MVWNAEPKKKEGDLLEKRVYDRASKEMTCQKKVLVRSGRATVRGLRRQMTTPRVVLG